MTDEPLTVRLEGDDGRLHRALRSGRVQVVDGDEEADLVVQVLVDTARAVAESSLTAREFDVLVELARGATNGEIADTLFIAENTVKNHVRSILLKLPARSRTEAVVRAHQRGLLQL